MRALTTVLTAFLGTVGAVAAYAHPPYEDAPVVVRSSDGQELRLVRYYTDGIIVGDPVRLQVRAASGHVLSESPMGRDLILWRFPGHRFVFLYTSPLNVVPSGSWDLVDAVFRPAPGYAVALGVVAPLLEHWFGYPVALGFFFVPVAAGSRALRSKSKLRLLALGEVAVFGVVWWLMWLYVVAAFSPLTLPACAVLIGATFLLLRGVEARRVSKEPQNN